ncbi:uncharacterized protein CC84DRAFT_1175747 [Paraphaeosphaeria sporulosa]|uniref:Uncharacterized protein n=1 Tax=Paraphaeosphaeria sporulosa TaxID=1460663 RepID=A0A177CD76_9PLEO|nr:uncharacterized protein CC84DRAFT_1175747 [Paraphaeosphaeria sporulosa]OAG05594.1 hypothetical protein CC84DRAFT_1175747 [Paraphaeosphaeria sporulosa]
MPWLTFGATRATAILGSNDQVKKFEEVDKDELIEKTLDEAVALSLQRDAVGAGIVLIPQNHIDIGFCLYYNIRNRPDPSQERRYGILAKWIRSTYRFWASIKTFCGWCVADVAGCHDSARGGQPAERSSAGLSTPGYGPGLDPGLRVVFLHRPGEGAGGNWMKLDAILSPGVDMRSSAWWKKKAVKLARTSRRVP